MKYYDVHFLCKSKNLEDILKTIREAAPRYFMIFKIKDSTIINVISRTRHVPKLDFIYRNDLSRIINYKDKMMKKELKLILEEGVLRTVDNETRKIISEKLRRPKLNKDSSTQTIDMEMLVEAEELKTN